MLLIVWQILVTTLREEIWFSLWKFLIFFFFKQAAARGDRTTDFHNRKYQIIHLISPAPRFGPPIRQRAQGRARHPITRFWSSTDSGRHCRAPSNSKTSLHGASAQLQRYSWRREEICVFRTILKYSAFALGRWPFGSFRYHTRQFFKYGFSKNRNFRKFANFRRQF